MIRRAKGLQFRAVAVIGVDRTTLPLASVAQRQTDDAARRASEEQERNLLYVACSRSRERLLVTCVREPSTFLDVLRLRGSQEQRVSEMRPNVDRADSATPQPAVRAHLEIVFVTSPDLFDMQPKERRKTVVTPQHQGS